jgi:hypothetical protein
MAVLFASALELDAGSQGATSSTAGTGYQPRPQCICGIASRSAGTRLVKQTLAAFFQKSATPLANCVFVNTELGSDILACDAVRHDSRFQFGTLNCGQSGHPSVRSLDSTTACRA